MFTLDKKLIFINIDQDYLRKLHSVCSEVYYKPNGYDNKPYIGILVNKNDRKYVIPLSSAYGTSQRPALRSKTAEMRS